LPTIQYNIDRILERVPDQSPQTILDMLDEIQTIVYSQDCLQTQKILDATGLPPYIVTTDGVYEYDCPSDCRRTAAVFSLADTLRKINTRPVGPAKAYYFRNKGYANVGATTRDATPGKLAKLFFADNPGNTTDVYYHLYFIKPTPLTDVSIQLTLPDEVHYLLRKAVIAMFTTEEYGESPQDEATIERVSRKIRNSLNRGYMSNVGQTPIQEEYQDDNFRYYGYRI
jgi:hypothetical protein